MKNPIIFDLDNQSLETVQNKFAAQRTIDTYKEQLEDLFLVRNPKYRFNKNYTADLNRFIKEHSSGVSLEQCGKWVFFPWNNALVHYLNDAEHQELRTARNKNFILPQEQEKFYHFTVGVAGLSVGSHGALTLALMGGSKKIKLADPDTVSPTNLNRMRFDFMDIGINKAELVAQYIYQLNPYAKVSVYTEGINEQNIEEFVEGLDLLVEELDDIEMKVNMRKEAKKQNIPVVMATDNGDNVIMDIERFDLDPNLPVFGGKLDGFDLKDIRKNPQKMFEAMAKIIDLSLVPQRILHSVLEVGKTIYSWPQMATAATLSGVALAYVIRKIALGEELNTGRTEVNLDLIFDPRYAQQKAGQQKEVKKFLKAMNPNG